MVNIMWGEAPPAGTFPLSSSCAIRDAASFLSASDKGAQMSKGFPIHFGSRACVVSGGVFFSSCFDLSRVRRPPPPRGTNVVDGTGIEFPPAPIISRILLQCVDAALVAIKPARRKFELERLLFLCDHARYYYPEKDAVPYPWNWV